MLCLLEKFAVHICHLPHTHSHSCWTKLSGVMFCDKRQSQECLNCFPILPFCKSPREQNFSTREMETGWCFLSRPIKWIHLVQVESYVYSMLVWDQLFIAQKRSLHLGPCPLRKSQKGQETNRMKTGQISNKSQACLAGRGSAAVVSKCCVLLLRHRTSMFSQVCCAQGG